MSLYQSPGIVTNGLRFYYDMSNVQKSFNGPPTTNLTPDLGIQAIQAGPTVTYVGVEDGWKKYSLNGTWSAGTYPYSIGIDPVTFTGGVTYSSGIYIRTNVPEKFASLFTGMNYVNQPMNNVGTSFSIAQADGSVFVGRSGFQYTSTTGQVGYLLSQPIVGQTFNGALDFVYIKQGQVEVGSFPTPFVAGTRSNTQAIVDLTGNNTVTATSLTYASDGTFSFNGTSNSISSETGLVTGANNFTCEVWAYNSGNGFLITPQSNGIDNWLSINSSNWNVTYTQFADVNNRAFTTGGTTAPIGTWSCCAFSIVDNTVYIWVNGSYSGSVTEPFTIGNWGGINWIFGQRGNSTNWFNGRIGNVKVYNRKLSDLEVQQNFNALRGRYGL